MITWLFLMPVRSSTFWMQTLRAVSVSRRAPCIVISTFWSLPFTTSAQHHKERSAPRSKSTEQLRPSCNAGLGSLAPHSMTSIGPQEQDRSLLDVGSLSLFVEDKVSESLCYILMGHCGGACDTHCE